MPHIKKTVVMFIASALLGGGAWYLNTTGGLSGISSSVLNTSTFSCTEDSLSGQASLYRKTLLRHKKAIVIKRKLEAEIEVLKKNDPKNQLQKKQDTLTILSRQINTYYRFIKKYDTCRKEIKLNPAVSSGIMSGEAKVAVSEKEYQALAAFEISSPTGLNTYLSSLQFKVDTLPALGMIADTWFLLHEGANPISCQISSDAALIDCELSGDMPVDIMSGMTRTYGIAAHITALHGSGTVDIQISKIFFNDSRVTSMEHIESPLLSFGIMAPVVAEVSNPQPSVVSPSITAEETTQITTSNDVQADEIPGQTATPDASETPEVDDTETGGEIIPSDVSVEQESQTDTEELPVQTETVVPPASETTQTETNTDASENSELPDAESESSGESTPTDTSDTPPVSDTATDNSSETL